MLEQQHFAIKTIGKADILSPLMEHTYHKEGLLNFVNDTAAIPVCIESVCDTNARQLYFECAGPREKIYFHPEEVTAAVVTCGGLCPGLNNAVRSIVMQLYHRYDVHKIIGIRYGLKGLDPLSGYEPVELTPKTVTKIHEQGGSFLGTSRGTINPDIMADTLASLGVNMLFCLGGDGTQRAVHRLCNAIEAKKLKIAVVGLPKTIDNDIVYVEKTFGLDTAVTIAKEAARSAHSEAESVYNGIGLVKVMGRNAGFIAALTTLANNDVNFCLIPEVPFELYGTGAFLEILEDRLSRRHHAVIVVAEGAGQELFPTEEQLGNDASGNKRLNDIGLFLKKHITEYFKNKKIPIDLKYIDPSYMIRSVPTNAQDSIFAATLGRMAVDAAMAGKTDMLIGYWHGRFTHVPLALATADTKNVDPKGELWRDVLSATGQPLSLKIQ